MQAREKVVEIVRAAIEEVNAQLPPESRVALDLETPLFGPQATLGSLGLVNLVVATEQRMNEAFGIEVSLTDEQATSRWEQIFESVASLVDYLCTWVGDE
jgi:acyl carrier protein